MNKYFGNAYGKRNNYERNKTLAGVRAAILQNKSMLLGTSKPEYWHSILRETFPDVTLRITEQGVLINERKD